MITAAMAMSKINNITKNILLGASFLIYITFAVFLFLMFINFYFLKKEMGPPGLEPGILTVLNSQGSVSKAYWSCLTSLVKVMS